VGLGIGFDERDKPIAGVMHNASYAHLASHFAVHVIMFEDNDRLLLTFTRMVNIPCVKVAIVTVVSANRTDAVLLREESGP
jgi:hypothetical protein